MTLLHQWRVGSHRQGFAATNGESEATDGVMPHCSSRKNPFSFFGKRYIIKQWQIEDCGGNNGFFKR